MSNISSNRVYRPLLDRIGSAVWKFNGSLWAPADWAEDHLPAPLYWLVVCLTFPFFFLPNAVLTLLALALLTKERSTYFVSTYL